MILLLLMRQMLKAHLLQTQWVKTRHKVKGKAQAQAQAQAQAKVWEEHRVKHMMVKVVLAKAVITVSLAPGVMAEVVGAVGHRAVI
jgi:hypothetical protein